MTARDKAFYQVVLRAIRAMRGSLDVIETALKDWLDKA